MKRTQVLLEQANVTLFLVECILNITELQRSLLFTRKTVDNTGPVVLKLFEILSYNNVWNQGFFV